MNVFQEDLMHGYTKYTKNFDQWCEKASPVLGKIRQCGIIELDRNGNALIAANRPDIGEENLDKQFFSHQNVWSFYENPTNEITTHTSQFGHEGSVIYRDAFKCSWFAHRELIDNDIQQISVFSSDSPVIYETLIQNLSLVKKFIKFFKEENKDIINYYRDKKFNLAAESPNYFIAEEECKTEREKLNYLLQMVRALDRDVTISKREWQCIKMLEFGKSASQSGEILGISRRTVETHLVSVKNKLRVHTKSEILDIVN